MAFALLEVADDYTASLRGVYELYRDADDAGIAAGLGDFDYRIVNFTRPKPRVASAAREWAIARQLVKQAAQKDRAFAAGLAAKGWSV